MKPIDDILNEQFLLAIGQAFGAENASDPLIKPADPRHADYQSNIAMSLAKRVAAPPRQVATRIIAQLQLAHICSEITIAGPGFINLRLKKEFLQQALTDAFITGSRAGIDPVPPSAAQTVVIDYSGPNVAKQMHVGHLRTTIIGDALARTLEFLGHTVIRQNHIGDFGTQFGMLIHHLRSLGVTDQPLAIEDLDRYYKEATAQFKADPAFREIARHTVVQLQQGQPAAVALWNRMRLATHEHYSAIYQLLNVTLNDDHERGESFYASRLPKIIQRVKTTLEFGGESVMLSAHSGTSDDTFDEPTDHAPPQVNGDLPQTQDNVHRAQESTEPAPITKAFAAISDGAFCVFLPGYVDRQKLPLPLMLQKRDGGYPYGATDLAGCYFRVREDKTTPAEQKPLHVNWHADRIIILTDSRQSQHFAMVFDAFRAAGWARNPLTDSPVSLEHAPSGSILGDDGKPFKTRSGDTVKLHDLLTEAVERAAHINAERGAELSPQKRAAVAQAVGIGAVKYADLRQDRTTDYIFAWDRMLSLEGNTGPYLQYQYARIQSIYRRGEITRAQLRAQNPPLLLDSPDELALAKKLLQFGPVVQSVARDIKPHHLCTYLYELCGTFSGFFERCPVLKAPTEEIKLSRLLLCDMVATTLRIGLQDLLGIPVLDEM